MAGCIQFARAKQLSSCTTSLVPGADKRGKKSVYYIHMHVNFQKFLENRITNRLHWPVSQQIFLCGRCIPPTNLCVNNEEGAMKTLSSSVARIIAKCYYGLFILVKCYYTQWHNLSIEVHWSPQTNGADIYHQSDIISDFKSFRICFKRNIALA